MDCAGCPEDGWEPFSGAPPRNCTLSATIVTFVGRRVVRVSGPQVSGMIAGAQTQPAVLAFANERTGFDVRVGLGYALVYPAAMIAKIR